MVNSRPASSKWSIILLLGTYILLTSEVLAGSKLSPEINVFLSSSDWLTASIKNIQLPFTELEQQLGNGFESTIIMSLSLNTVKPKQTILTRTRIIQIRKLLWDSGYMVVIQDKQAEQKQILQKFEEIQVILSQVDQLPIIEKERIDTTSAYFVKGIIELNPVSDQEREMTRDWISPRTTNGDGGGLVGFAVKWFVDVDHAFGSQQFEFKSNPFLKQDIAPANSK